MNNLLRTLTENQAQSAYPDADLRLLLNTVKDARRHTIDSKASASDPFFDSLENLLADLRTVTIDNHDADAFLKPVSKAEAPDYYEVIAHPMDFSTMLKKVKARSYKSKREFKDDLELIWNNCLTYNAAENHPLRPCVKRLKLKADRLLKYITDKKERADPPIPSDITATHVARPRINGNGPINGRSYSHQRTSSTLSLSKSTTPTLKASPSLSTTSLNRRDVPFSDTPAIDRTPAGMALFVDIDKFVSASSNASITSQDDVSELWWSAVQSDSLLGNGLPQIPFASSSSSSSIPSPSKSSTVVPTTPRKPKAKRRKQQQPTEDSLPPKSLLNLMNNNIKTLKRLRHTNAKFAALNVNNNTNGEDAEGVEGTQVNAAPAAAAAVVVGDEEGLGIADDKIDERSWISMVKGKRGVRGIEIGEDAATDCMRWMGTKVLEHAGFQGTSQVTLDVLAGVASEFFHNVGRTIRYLSDKYANTMTSEEIILHTLFECGISRVQELERYVSDDVERYGSRLTTLEEKLVSAYRETTAGEVLEDEGLFEEEDEEEAGALAIGDFADALGEDYLGLRELGIAAEFGMSSLSIPKKLLKGKKQSKASAAAAKPTEPPPPYPPPPPFIPLTVSSVENQIGILHHYYQTRFNQLALSSLPPVPTALPGPTLLPELSGPSIPTTTPADANGTTPTVAPSSQNTPPVPGPPPSLSPNLVLPDDAANPANVKMGPLGQIVRGGPATTTKKKKAGGGGTGPGGMGTELGATGPSPKKKKTGMVGVGTGNGRKKKVEEGTTAGGSVVNGTQINGQAVQSGSQPPQAQSQSQSQAQMTPQLAPAPHGLTPVPMTYMGPPPVAAYTMSMHMHMQPPPPPPSVMGQ
ncbi:hypothetical protein H0H93_005693 [Arthromyces matolae]|nr:hypothetical protein H0H93_005693 [Arthromyces matolae]